MDYNDYVVIDSLFYRPAEVDLLIASPVNAQKKLGWSSETSFVELVEMMVENDLKALQTINTGSGQSRPQAA